MKHLLYDLYARWHLGSLYLSMIIVTMHGNVPTASCHIQATIEVLL